MSRAHRQDDPFGISLVAKIHDDTYDFIDPRRGDAMNAKVLITGASKGIGRSIAISYARAGASSIALLARSDLAVVAVEVSEAAKQAGRKVPQLVLLSVDISDSVSVAEAARVVEKEIGSLDVVINNASRLETWLPTVDTDIEDWWRTWEVNIKGSFLITRAMLNLLLRGRLKTLVMISSAGALVTLPGASAYQGTKTAQIRMNDFLMAEYGDQGLIAFAMHPAGTETESSLNMPQDYHYFITQTPELPADTVVWMTRERRDWLAGRFVYGPMDMEQLEAKKEEIIAYDLLKLKLTI